MKQCTHYREASCIFAARSVSPGACGVCPAYQPGDGERVEVRVKGVPAKIQPVPRDQWPLWAKAIGKMRADKDVGVGTTWERELGHVGTAIKASLKLLGIPCGCAKRKAEWDARFPYR